jgi:hypothetical protein
MIKAAQTKAVNDLLEIAGQAAQFTPRVGQAFPLTVIYGKSADMANMGSFELREYEHQFFCRASDIKGKSKGAEILFDERTFAIKDVQINEPGAILYGD